MQIALQLLTSTLTLLSVRMAGNGDQRFNYVGLFNQILWIIVILNSQTYGILVLTTAMTYQYAANIRKWKANGEREERTHRRRTSRGKTQAV